MARKNEFAVWTVLTIAGGGCLLVAVKSMLDGSANMLFFLIPAFVSMMALGIRDQAASKSRVHLRNEFLATEANRLGFTYEASGTASVFGKAPFLLTRQATVLAEAYNPDSFLGKLVSAAAPKSVNLMTLTANDHVVTLFDFQFSYNEIIQRKTVASIESARLSVPYFALFPVNSRDKLTGRQSIHSGHRATTHGPSELSSAFDVIVQHLQSDMKLEVGNGHMLLYRASNHALLPAEIELRYREVLQVYSIVAEQIEALQVDVVAFA